MSETKTFTYSQDGLSYTVTVYEDPDNPGSFKADITVTEGSMDVNAVYWSSEDYDGDNAAPTKGPLNMNGEGSQYEGEDVTWAGGEELSRPGLRGEGEDKETFVGEGETLTVDLGGLESLDDIDFFGIRATSVNGDDSIKGVSGEEPEANTYGKVQFIDEDGFGKAYVWDDVDADLLDRAGLEPDAEGTFANFLAVWENDPDVFKTQLADVVEVRFWPELPGQFDPKLTIEAPEDGFESFDALLEAYDAAIAQMEADGYDTSSLQIAMLGEGEGWTGDPVEDEEPDYAAA